MIVTKCPKCNSDKINRFRHPYGKVWCGNCGYIIRKEGERKNDNET